MVPTFRFGALLALVTAALVAASPSSARATASPTLEVTFSTNGTISVTLADGTPVGTTGGPATVVPAGYYTLELNAPITCTFLPDFELHGPGVDFVNDMGGGTVPSQTFTVYLQPNSSYTWRVDNANAPATYAFKTSAIVEGTPPAQQQATTSTGGQTVSNGAVVGSALVPFRGTLTGAIDAAGRLTIAHLGKRLVRLAPGWYRIVVTDRSSTRGFTLGKLRRPPIAVTGEAFLGMRSRTIRLTAGTWLFRAQPGTATYPVVVSERGHE